MHICVCLAVYAPHVSRAIEPAECDLAIANPNYYNSRVYLELQQKLGVTAIVDLTILTPGTPKGGGIGTRTNSWMALHIYIYIYFYLYVVMDVQLATHPTFPNLRT